MFALVALASLAFQSPLMESFQVGQNVDLSQGFYVCKTVMPIDTVERIALFRDPRTRKNKAASLGCKLQQNDHPDVVQVRKVQAAYCGPLVTRDDGMMCGREAHQLIIRRSGGRVRSVVFVLDDYVID